MISAYLFNRKYFFRAYSLMAVLLCMMWFETELNIRMTKALGKFNQKLSDCESKDASCSVNEMFRFAMEHFSATFLIVSVLRCSTSYIVNIFVFYWRQALSEYYLKNWNLINDVEGASQRIQEDTARWAKQVRLTIFDLVSALMTFLKLIPELLAVSSSIPELFLLGKMKNGILVPPILVFFIQFLLLVTSSCKLPYLHFENQKLEAKYRKLLALNEDTEEQLDQGKLRKVYDQITRNYYTTFKYTFPFFYIQVTANELSFFLGNVFLWPSFFHGSMTVEMYYNVQKFMGDMLVAFTVIQERWRGFTEIMSVYRRLIDFESRISSANQEGIKLKEMDLD